jgi:hypothetical protein
MDKYRLVYPNGVVVEVEANSQQEAEDIGFAFGALEEVPQDVKEAA